MTNPHSTRLIERAVDELKRGWPVRLTAGDAAFDVQAAESVRMGEWDGPFRLVLSGQRARYLGISGGEAISVAFTAMDSVLLQALLYDTQLQANGQAEPAHAYEQAALELVCQTGLLPAAIISEAQDRDAVELPIATFTGMAEEKPALVLDNIIQLPIAQCENARAAVFRERGGLTHLALIIGEPDKTEAPLARLHSSCLTGDILGSLRCDCGDQLRQALHAIVQEGNGVLLYLNQEGRGIGLANKLRAYRLQEEGLDTVDANLALGFAEDERDFALAAEMLKALCLTRIRLLTNNPKKMDVLQRSGIEITARLPLAVEAGRHNEHYLKTKSERMGHQY